MTVVSPVRTEQHDHVLTIRIEREGQRNAINAETTAGIDSALDRLDDDDDLWVGVLTGTTSVFSAGSDLKQGSGGPTARGGEYGIIRRARRKPLIAAVEGFAVGGGMEIVLSCDLVVAGRGASFGLPEAKRGMPPAYGGMFRTARALPLNIAKEMLLTGDPLTADRAYGLGLVNVLSEPGGALDAALALADRVVAAAPRAVQESLRVLEAAVVGDESVGWRESRAAVDALVGSPDFEEGRASFLEKRPPSWTGR